MKNQAIQPYRVKENHRGEQDDLRIIRERRSAQDADIIERHWHGESIYSIAESYHITASAVSQRIAASLLEFEEVTRQGADAIIQQHKAILDEAMVALIPQIKAGDTKAINTAVNVLKREAELLGLDRPMRVEQNIEVVYKMVDPYTIVEGQVIDDTNSNGVDTDSTAAS